VVQALQVVQAHVKNVVVLVLLNNLGVGQIYVVHLQSDIVVKVMLFQAMAQEALVQMKHIHVKDVKN
jgi:copper(I)-binding protein